MADTPAQVALDERGLLPCPFCGGKMMLREALWPSEGDTDGIIHAIPGDCPLPEFNVGIADQCASVSAAWNSRALSSLPGEALDDGQGALVERYADATKRNAAELATMPIEVIRQNYREFASEYHAHLTRENAALRADKERLERERGRYRGGLQVLATTFYKGDEHQDYAKHVLGNDAAERRLAEQGQVQGEKPFMYAVRSRSTGRPVFDEYCVSEDASDLHKYGLTDLIERLEKLDGPDAFLDEAIWEGIGDWPAPEYRSCDYMKAFGTPLTGSLDAATALVERVLPGCQWAAWGGGIEAGASRPRCMAHVSNGQRKWTASDTPNAAIALCLALLCALQQEEKR